MSTAPDQILYLDVDGLPVDEEMLAPPGFKHLVSLCRSCYSDDSWVRPGVVVQCDCGKWVPSTRDGLHNGASVDCVPCVMAEPKEFCAKCGCSISSYLN